MGRLATILFAHRLGTSLEPECKMYRLAADIFNDTAMVLDCLSPAFPKPARVMVLSFSSCLRALCGVCAGSAKASLSAHFAKRANLGELNAKDSSQETVISLLGMLAGSMVVSWVTTPMATWATLIALLSVHLATNYAAVRAVSMTSLNRQRANIVFSHLLHPTRPSVLSPTAVSEQERVFEWDGIVRTHDDCHLGKCTIGVSLQTLLTRINGSPRIQSGAFSKLFVNVADLLEVFANEGYVLWCPFRTPHDSIEMEVLIVLKKNSTTLDQLKAWMHAMLVLRSRQATDPSTALAKPDEDEARQLLNELRATLEQANQVLHQYAPALRSAGWDLDTAALETRAGVRALLSRSQASSGP